MKSNRKILTATFGSLVLGMLFLPAAAMAQAAGGRGGAGMGGLQQLRQVMSQLDLSAEQKSKIQGIMKQAMQDLRDTMQGIQDATPQERQAKMQDAQKTISDAKDKIADELTTEQKAKYYPLMAKASLRQMTDLLPAIKSAAAKQDMTDDLRKQVDDAVDDTKTTLDGYKSDADAVNDADSAKDFQEKLTQTQMDLRKQIVGILGQEDAAKLMQAARQAMRPAGLGGASGGGFGVGRREHGAGGQTAPTTAPSPN